MCDETAMVQRVVSAYPATEAIYLFGSRSANTERPDSDVDIAILFPPDQAKQAGSLVLTDLHLSLQDALKKDVDLVNLRQVSTVFRKEIIMGGRRIYCASAYAADEFEMHTLSLYQKLNDERAAIIEDGLRAGRFYDV